MTNVIIKAPDNFIRGFLIAAKKNIPIGMFSTSCQFKLDSLLHRSTISVTVAESHGRKTNALMFGDLFASLQIR